MARVPYVARGDLPESQRHFYDEIDNNRGRLNIYAAILNSPEAASCVGALGSYLRFQSQLPPQTRELAILTVAREMSCDYEWAQHKPVARSVGVSDPWIAAIRDGLTTNEIPHDQALVMRYVSELMHHHNVTDEMFNMVSKQLSTRDLVDLTLLVGYYMMVAITLLALKVEVDEDLVDKEN